MASMAKEEFYFFLSNMNIFNFYLALLLTLLISTTCTMLIALVRVDILTALLLLKHSL